MSFLRKDRLSNEDLRDQPNHNKECDLDSEGRFYLPKDLFHWPEAVHLGDLMRL